MAEEIRDETIIEALLDRDERAISMLMAKYDHYLQKIAWNILANAEDCEECKNDVYMKAWKSIPSNQPVNLKAYLAKMIRNIALDRYKEKNRAKRIPSEYTVSMEELEESLPGSYGIEESYYSVQLQKVMDDFVRGLPQRQQYIFVSRYYFHDKASEIASALNLSTPMIYHELALIRDKLKKRLEEEKYLP